MFACPGPEVTFTCRDAPFALLALPCVEAENFGLNGKIPQSVDWNGYETLLAVPVALAIVPVTDIALQLVGLNMNPSRLMSMSTFLMSSGTPFSSSGSGSLITVSAEVCG